MSASSTIKTAPEISRIFQRLAKAAEGSDITLTRRADGTYYAHLFASEDAAAKAATAEIGAGAALETEVNAIIHRHQNRITHNGRGTSPEFALQDLLDKVEKAETASKAA